jgi:hypothetical protein
MASSIVLLINARNCAYLPELSAENFPQNLLPDIFIPQVSVIADEIPHQLDAL